MSRTAPAFVHEDNRAQFALDRKPPGVARAISTANEIRLPWSGNRLHAGCWLKLLSRVSQAPGGFAFEGQLLRPGSTVPLVGFPQPAVLLECSGPQGGRGHNRGHTRYIVWRWDVTIREWEDLGQASSVSDEWAGMLRGIASGALNPVEARPQFDCAGSVDRIVSFAESEMHGMTRPLRNLVLERLYGRIAGLVAA
jgi:hypothetical protein